MSHFPKAHIVTFKYYVGVIHFLDEEYHKVCLRCLPTPAPHPTPPVFLLSTIFTIYQKLILISAG